MITPRVCLLVIGDGRDALLADTLASFREQARDYELVETISVDDRDHRLGFCGALSTGMHLASLCGDATVVMHLEEDWRFLRPFSVGSMAAILQADPEAFQVSLLRGPHGAETPAGPLGGWPERVHPMTLHYGSAGERIEYLRHDLYYTTNPNLIRRGEAHKLVAWSEPRCEANIGMHLVGAGRWFAALGDGEPWIEHTGTTRTGTGY